MFRVWRDKLGPYQKHMRRVRGGGGRKTSVDSGTCNRNGSLAVWRRKTDAGLSDRRKPHSL